MTSFTDTWDATFETLPPDSEALAQGAGRIRTLKLALSERWEVDHSWAGDAHDGKHKQVTLRVAAGDPTLDTGDGGLYTKAVSGTNHLHFKDSAGSVHQLTAGLGGALMPPGVTVPYAGTAAPTGWLFCFGQAVSRTTYAALFAALSTTYGVGDGSTTFNLPDLRGRVIAGKDDMGGSSANRLTSPINGDNLGAAGGAESHTLVSGEMPSHSHTATVTDTHSHNIQTYNSPGGTPGVVGNSTGVANSVQTTTGTASGSITVANTSTGGGGAHNNMQPTIILNYIIKT